MYIFDLLLLLIIIQSIAKIIILHKKLDKIKQEEHESRKPTESIR